MTLFSPGALENVYYAFIAITPRFTLTWSGSDCYGSSMGQIELFNYLTVCKQMTDC